MAFALIDRVNDQGNESLEGEIDRAGLVSGGCFSIFRVSAEDESAGGIFCVVRDKEQACNGVFGAAVIDDVPDGHSLHFPFAGDDGVQRSFFLREIECFHDFLPDFLNVCFRIFFCFDFCQTFFSGGIDFPDFIEIIVLNSIPVQHKVFLSICERIANRRNKISALIPFSQGTEAGICNRIS